MRANFVEIRPLFSRNFERYFAIFLPKFEALSKKIRVVNRKLTKGNEISMKQKFEGAKYRRIFTEEIVPQDKHLHVWHVLAERYANCDN